MCNIAGYVGAHEAAPILIEMIRVQEGLNGGFFTGLAVHDKSALHYRKVQGELAILLEETDAASLTGKTGIIHSRTPSGGNGLWAHPFATERNGILKMCYVANGTIGMFRDQKEAFNELADQLIADGYDVPCKIDLQNHQYNRLSTGEAVHMSDVMCQLIYKYKDAGMNTEHAMTSAFTRMPSEIVGLVVEDESPDRIYFSRINKPMFVGFDSDGAYLASSPIAFPESVKDYRLLPALSSGVVFCNRVEVTDHYTNFPIPVMAFDEGTVAVAANAILSLLKEREAGLRDMFAVVRDVLPKDVLTQSDAIVYCAATKLLGERRIDMRPSRRTVKENDAPHTLFFQIKGA